MAQVNSSRHSSAGLENLVVSNLKTLRTRRATLFALFAIAWQILIPLGQGITLANAKDNGLPFALVICTGNGLQTLAAPAGEEQPADQGPALHCPICMAHAAGTATLDNATEIEAPVPSPGAISTVVLTDSVSCRTPDQTANSTRGPPLKA